MNRTIIDFVSFSGSPELLQRCKEMAKQRFAIAQTNEFQSQNVVAVAHREKTQIAYFMENLAHALGCDERNEFADRKSTRLNSSHSQQSRMPSSA